jgi:hypothetical protein
VGGGRQSVVQMRGHARSRHLTTFNVTAVPIVSERTLA